MFNCLYSRVVKFVTIKSVTYGKALRTERKNHGEGMQFLQLFGLVFICGLFLPTIECGMESVLTQSGLATVQEVTKTYIVNSINQGFTHFQKNYYFYEGGASAHFFDTKITDILISNLKTSLVADKHRVHVLATVSFKIESQLEHVTQNGKAVDLESLTILVNRTKVGLVIKPFQSRRGRPSISVTHCVSSVGDFVPDFGKKTHLKFVFNPLLRLYGKFLNQTICNEVKQLTNDFFSKKTSSLILSAHFGRLTFDYGLSRPMQYENGHIKVYHKGTFGKNIIRETKMNVPLTRMIGIAMSEGSLNSYFYELFWRKNLKILCTVTLDTELAEVFGFNTETTEEYNLKVTFKIPHASIFPSGILVDAPGTAFISSNKLHVSRKIHFTCLARYEVYLIDSKTIQFQPKDFDVILEDENNPDEIDSQFIKDYLELKMGAKLRELGFKVKIPMMKGLSMINGILECKKRYIAMAMDIKVDNQIWD